MARLATILTGFVFFINLGLIFFYAPLERTMGVVQKIFYVHLASAWIGFLAFFVVFVGSIMYLRSRKDKFDQLALASAEIGILFTTLVLTTGPLWAKPVWNTWWTWDPRLTSTLVMWFMYLGYIILHQGGVQETIRPRLAAVYGIIAFVNVPLVFFSIRWWRTLHPVGVIASDSGLTSEMRLTLFFSLFTFLLLYTLLLYRRFTILKLALKVRRLTEKIYLEE